MNTEVIVSEDLTMEQLLESFETKRGLPFPYQLTLPCTEAEYQELLDNEKRIVWSKLSQLIRKQLAEPTRTLKDDKYFIYLIADCIFVDKL